MSCQSITVPWDFFNHKQDPLGEISNARRCIARCTFLRRDWSVHGTMRLTTLPRILKDSLAKRGKGTLNQISTMYACYNVSYESVCITVRGLSFKRNCNRARQDKKKEKHSRRVKESGRNRVSFHSYFRSNTHRSKLHHLLPLSQINPTRFALVYQDTCSNGYLISADKLIFTQDKSHTRNETNNPNCQRTLIQNQSI